MNVWINEYWEMQRPLHYEFFHCTTFAGISCSNNKILKKKEKDIIKRDNIPLIH